MDVREVRLYGESMHEAAIARFNDRAGDYARGRASYPAAVVGYIADRVDLASATVADVGAGTGIFTRQLVGLAKRVIAVEPNAHMREQAAKELAGSGVEIREGAGEATGLPDSSVDVITCAQALHWFNNERTLVEWRRVLRGRRLVFVLWNNVDETRPFEAGYQAAIVRANPEARVTMDAVQATQRNNVLFPRGAPERGDFTNIQRLDWPGLVSRTHSLSFKPRTEAGMTQLLAEVRKLFDAHATDGVVELQYITTILSGGL